MSRHAGFAALLAITGCSDGTGPPDNGEPFVPLPTSDTTVPRATGAIAVSPDARFCAIVKIGNDSQPRTIELMALDDDARPVLEGIASVLPFVPTKSEEEPASTPPAGEDRGTSWTEW